MNRYHWEGRPLATLASTLIDIGVIGRFGAEDGQNLMCVLSGSLATPPRKDVAGTLVC